jgi:hypothetical protein
MNVRIPIEYVTNKDIFQAKKWNSKELW